jgi:spectinomycin phosphotransferase
MYDEPDDLSLTDIADALRRFWSIDVTSIEYAPVGFGSYHWRVMDTGGRRWFVTADRLTKLAAGDDEGFRRLRSAYETASALRKSGLDFVVAPVEGGSGQLLQRIPPGWALALFEWIDGLPAGDGSWPAGTRRVDAARLVGRLHLTPPPDGLRRFRFEIDYRDEIFDAAPERTGPYAERARDVVRDATAGIKALLARYDRLVATLELDSSPWVVSHGEPHSANFIAGADGRLHLIDWDTVRLAPPERDLAALPMREPGVLAAYLDSGVLRPPRPDAIELFDAWWVLTEISLYARYFRQPHIESEDSRVSWRGLQENVSAAMTWTVTH